MLLFSEMDDDARYNRKFRAGLYTLWSSITTLGGDLRRSRWADQGNQSHAISILAEFGNHLLQLRFGAVASVCRKRTSAWLSTILRMSCGHWRLDKMMLDLLLAKARA